MRHALACLISGFLAAALPGCSDGPLALTGLATSSVTTPGLASPGLAKPSLANSGAAASSLGGANSEHAEPPVEIYSRIARGALRCWFGTEGSLKKSHVFHADVAPVAANTGAEIAIYERDKSGQTPRAIRAYRITIARSGEGSNVQSENYRMPGSVARDMGADIGRWGQGQEGCSVVGLGGWTAEQVEEEPVKAGTTPSKKAKAAR